MLFDRYRRQSVKATTRGRRSKNMAQIVERVSRAVPLQVFPALGEKKADYHGFSQPSVSHNQPFTLQSSYNNILWLFKLKAIFFCKILSLT